MGACGGDPPEAPDPAQGIWDASIADLETLPTRLAVETAAKNGQKITIGGKEYDFTGLGEADFQAKYADAMAGTLLDLQKKYGSDYVKQRITELTAGDPEGTQMRKDLWARIEKDAKATPDRPIAGALQEQIMGELRKGGSLTDAERSQVQQNTRAGQVARGNFLGNAASMQEAGAVVSASESKAAQRQQQALQFLGSGATPEDTAYRRDQQTLANLSAFVNGQSPTAQFSQLSGAQNQVVPFMTTTQGSGVNLNSGAQGVAYNTQANQIASNAWANQSNPWLTGLSMAPAGATIGLAWNAYNSQNGGGAAQMAGMPGIGTGGK